MNRTDFENKVKSMTAHDIIMAMVEGLRNPRTKIDMGTYGKMEEGICYGCAATNAVLHIMEANEEEVVGHILECENEIYDDFLFKFERAIDYLRGGNVDNYNGYAAYHGFALITPIPGIELPCLDDNYTEEQLKEYEILAKYQLTV